MAKASIVVHCGAGHLVNDKSLKGVEEAALIGISYLRKGKSALDAIEATINSLENNPLFHAGTGSPLTLNREVEMDASIMDGSTLKAGAVGMIKRVKNPISVARKVMEETNFILLVGDQAIRFARFFGYTDYDPITKKRLDEWKSLMASLEEGKYDEIPIRYRVRAGNIEPWIKWAKEDRLKKYMEASLGTVGAVAIDQNGEFATGTSTGSAMLRLPGRVGSSATICGGTYANESGAASATGVGETIIKIAVTKTACDLMKFSNMSAQKAAEDIINSVNKSKVSARVGIITLNHKGPGAAVNIEKGLPCTYIREDMDVPNSNFRIEVIGQEKAAQ